MTFERCSQSELNPDNISPGEAPRHVADLLARGFKIPDLNTVTSSPMRPTREAPLPLEAISPEGDTILLPFYAAVEAQRRIKAENTAILTYPWRGEKPFLVFRGRDAAGEKTIDLFNFIRLLEHLRVKGKRATMIFGLLTSWQREPPTRREYKNEIGCLEEKIDGETGFYDYLAVTVDGEISPDETLYPFPPFLKGLFDRTGAKVEEMIEYMLDGGYAKRVIVLPRVRHGGGMLENEFWKLQAFLRRALDLNHSSELASVSCELLEELGVPVFQK